MSSLGGPNIVTDGLILLLDAGNSKSYLPSENLLRYSSQIGTQLGVEYLVSNTPIITTNAVTAPDGTLTGTIIDNNGNGVANYIYSQNTSLSPNTTYTYSIYIKQAANTVFSLWIDENNFGGKRYTIYYTFATKVLLTGVAGNTTNNGFVIGSTSTDVGNGWIRISLTFQTSTTSVSGLVDMIARFGGNSTNYVWGRQLERSNSMSVYTPTTSSQKYQTSWYDRSGNGNTGTLINTPNFNSLNGGSIVFDGVDDYVDCGNIINSPTTLTVDFWVKNPGSNVIITKGYQIWEIRFSGDKFGGYVGVSYGSLYWFSISENYTILHGANLVNWNNFTYVYDFINSNIKFYTNGILMGTIAVGSMSSTYSPTNNLNIGRRVEGGGSSYLNGSVSLTKIYNRTLTSQEILQNFNATKSRFGL